MYTCRRRGKGRTRYSREEEWEQEATELCAPRPPTSWVVIPSRVFSTLATLLQDKRFHTDPHDTWSPCTPAPRRHGHPGRTSVPFSRLCGSIEETGPRHRNSSTLLHPSRCTVFLPPLPAATLAIHPLPPILREIPLAWPSHPPESG